MVAAIIALVCSRLLSDMCRFCFDPIIMLFRQDRADQTDHFRPGSENTHDARAPADLTIRHFSWVV